MLLNAPYPADIRVKKETSALVAVGFEIWLLCLRRNGEKYEEDFEGIHIQRIDAGKTKQQLAFWDVIMSITFTHPLFKKSAKKIIIDEYINIIHVHDLPLVGTALSLKKQKNIKVIGDFHENYPEAMALWFGWKKNIIVRLKNILFMNKKRWSKWESKAVNVCDQLISIIDEQKGFLLKKYPKLPENKITVITNTEWKSFRNQSVDDSVYSSLKGKFIVAYTGGLGAVRGIDIAVRGMSFLKTKTEIVLVIVGGGSSDFIVQLKEIIRKSDVERNVILMGHQPFEKVFSYMSLASINIIPHQKNLQNDNGIPHKLFQNMLTGNPVVVSSCNGLKRIITETKAGLVFEAGDPKDFADKIELLYNNKDMRDEIGKNGLKATLEGTYNWETTSKELVNLYHRLN